MWDFKAKRKNAALNLEEFLGVLFGKSDKSNYIYNIAEAHAVDIIARTIASCEIETFEKNKKTKNIEANKGELYWILNISPNDYENGTSFIYKLMINLLVNKKALILINQYSKEIDLHIADDFDISKDIYNRKTFYNITVKDDEDNILNIRKSYNTDNAIYFSIKNNMYNNVSKEFKENTIKILRAAQKSFITNNVPKWRLANEGNQPKILDAETKQEISYEKYKEKLTEGLLNDEASVILLSKIFELSNLNEKGNKNLSDFELIAKRISDTVAQKWDIPLDIFYGIKSEKSNGNNDFITFSLKLYFEMLDDGFNKGLVGKNDFINGEYIKINRLNINHKDLIDKASGWDKLISNGFSFNQLSKFLGLPMINEDWANTHYITKNYANTNSEKGEEDG